MKKNIALVLPAFNEEENILESFTNLKNGISRFPNLDFILYTIDDCSKDNTTGKIRECGQRLGLNLRHHKNKGNLGLVQTLKGAYMRVLHDADCVSILKTDLDRDFEQDLVLKSMLPYSDYDIVAGIRWREINSQDYIGTKYFSQVKHEERKREQIIAVMKSKFGFSDIDPPSAGTQLYKTDGIITEVLNHPIVENHNECWGLDLLIPLVARKIFGMEVPIINIEKGSYDPSRRGIQKIDSQYSKYQKILSYFC